MPPNPFPPPPTPLDGNALCVRAVAHRRRPIQMRQIWREIEKNDNAWPFRDPVDLAEVPDYTKVVAHPIGE